MKRAVAYVSRTAPAQVGTPLVFWLFLRHEADDLRQIRFHEQALRADRQFLASAKALQELHERLANLLVEATSTRFQPAPTAFAAFCDRVLYIHAPYATAAAVARPAAKQDAAVRESMWISRRSRVERAHTVTLGK